MQNLYPLFERNRILKKELLWSLRDYSFTHVQLEYKEYSQGIIRGCDIKVQGDYLAVGPGIVKYGRFICLMMEEEQIYCVPSEQIQYLKIRVSVDRSSPDYISYRSELLLDTSKPQDSEFELCRFNLRSGALLRDDYTGLKDMETEYDTINLIHADWGGLGGKSMSPSITRYFAEAVLANGNSQAEDRSFAYLSLSQPGALPMKVLTAYARHRAGRPEAANAPEVYQCLCTIIDNIQQGKEKGAEGKRERHRILVD